MESSELLHKSKPDTFSTIDLSKVSIYVEFYMESSELLHKSKPDTFNTIDRSKVFI